MQARLCRWLLIAVAVEAVSFVAYGAALEELPPVPVAVASFGAAVNGDGLYVYGGHIGEVHQHSVSDLSHAFYHLDLRQPQNGWQKVGDVQGLQGLPMVSHGNDVCRVGGMEARNAKGDPEDMYSLPSIRCYDTVAGSWRDLPPMPQGRSSHDAVVVGDQLFVVGGWQLRGKDDKPLWLDQMAVLDLKAEMPAWRYIPQPFERRALAVAAADGKVFAFGGLGRDGTSRRVDVFDIDTETWAEGMELPKMAGNLKGFGVSAFGVDGKVYLSGADGAVHALDGASLEWEENLGEIKKERFFHRLVPYGDHLLFVGGASFNGHLANVEALDRTQLVSAASMALAKASGVWPGFRGRGDGRVDGGEMPVHWSAEQNLGWRLSLPGYGQSAPVVWGETVYVTSAVGDEKETLVMTAVDLNSGEILWRRRYPASQKIEASEMVSRSAPTPTVDAERVYAFWESGDVVALSHDGETLWKRSLTNDYGPFEGNHGLASSPLLTDDGLIVQVTHGGPSYFVALDPATGENRWKVDRPSKTAWTTPIELADGIVLSSAAGRVEAFRSEDGEVLWSVNGIEKNHVPSVVASSGLVVAASSETGQSLAFRRDDSGAVEHDSILWRADGVASGFGSPAIQGPCVTFVNKAGVLNCLDPDTGESKWKHRLASSCWASPVLAGDRVYFFTKKGDTAVLELGDEGPTVVAENSLPIDGTVYGVAAVPKAFVIRTGTEILRIGGSEGGAPTQTASVTSESAKR
ncbi:MAG: PQQ-binding-like beta-propeller repeat protein [Acidobacteriota bacterium]